MLSCCMHTRSATQYITNKLIHKISFAFAENHDNACTQRRDDDFMHVGHFQLCRCHYHQHCRRALAVLPELKSRYSDEIDFVRQCSAAATSLIAAIQRRALFNNNIRQHYTNSMDDIMLRTKQKPIKWRFLYFLGHHQGHFPFSVKFTEANFDYYIFLLRIICVMEIGKRNIVTLHIVNRDSGFAV